MKVLSVLTAVLFSVPSLPPIQQGGAPASPGSVQGATLLAQSLAHLRGSQAVSDITLGGNARRIAGSVDETGAVLMRAITTGDARIDFSYPSGALSEARTDAGDGPEGQWRGPDNTLHPIPAHNLLTASPWFCPPVLLSRIASDARFVSTNGQSDVWHSQTVTRITVSLQLPGLPVDTVSTIQDLSRMDVYLDPSTFLPLGLSFNLHADDNANFNIPVEIRFSDYRLVTGVLVPYHIQQYLNNGLALDVQVESAVLNSGLTANSLQLQ
jgi:hypothetical protein